MLNQHTIHYDINIHEPLHTTTLDFRLFVTLLLYRQSDAMTPTSGTGRNETLGASDHSDHAIRASSGSGSRQGSWLGLPRPMGKEKRLSLARGSADVVRAQHIFTWAFSVAIEPHHSFLLLLLAIFSSRQSVVSHLHCSTLSRPQGAS